MNDQQKRRIGTTVGIAASTCSTQHRRAEQVYVRHSPPRADENGTHPIEIDAWVGYGTLGPVRLTRRQARELVGVLVEALAATEPQPPAVTS